MLEVQHLGVRFGELEIVRDLSFSVEPGQWLMIVGPNGAGKSTIVNAIAQGVPYTGKISADGKSLSAMKASERARRIGVLTQNHSVSYSFTVEEVVRLGRYAYSGGVLADRDTDGEGKVSRALEQTGMTELSGQSVLTLSGGELQRTFLAQLLAQDPELLMLDEPTNHLDLIYQKQVFALISDWIRDTGRAVISVVHDLSLARAYGTHALLMHRGDAVGFGEAREVLREENLNAAYGMDVGDWMRGLLKQWEPDAR